MGAAGRWLSPHGGRRRPRPGPPTTRPARGLAGLVDAAAPAVHGVAPRLRGHRRLPGPVVDTARLVATLLAFFLAVGVAAHALDELHGRPLRTRSPRGAGRRGHRAGWPAPSSSASPGSPRWAGLVPFIVVGPVWSSPTTRAVRRGGPHRRRVRRHWGAFPVLTAYVAQTGTLPLAPVLAAVGRVRPVGGPAGPEHPGPDAAPADRRGTGAPPTAGRLAVDRGPAGAAGADAPGAVVGGHPGGHGPGRGPAALGALDAPAEAGHGHLDHPVVAPLEQWVTEPAGDPHGRLARLDGPGHAPPREPGALGTDAQPGLPGQVASDGGVDGVGAVAPASSIAQPHAVGQWRGDHAAGAPSPVRQTVAVEVGTRSATATTPRNWSTSSSWLHSCVGRQPEGVAAAMREHWWPPRTQGRAGPRRRRWRRFSPARRGVPVGIGLEELALEGLEADGEDRPLLVLAVGPGGAEDAQSISRVEALSAGASLGQGADGQGELPDGERRPGAGCRATRPGRRRRPPTGG